MNDKPIFGPTHYNEGKFDGLTHSEVWIGYNGMNVMGVLHSVRDGYLNIMPSLVSHKLPEKPETIEYIEDRPSKVPALGAVILPLKSGHLEKLIASVRKDSSQLSFDFDKGDKDGS